MKAYFFESMLCSFNFFPNNFHLYKISIQFLVWLAQWTQPFPFFSRKPGILHQNQRITESPLIVFFYRNDKLLLMCWRLMNLQHSGNGSMAEASPLWVLTITSQTAKEFYSPTINLMTQKATDWTWNCTSLLKISRREANKGVKDSTVGNELFVDKF